MRKAVHGATVLLVSVEGAATLLRATFFFTTATTLVRNKKDLAATHRSKAEKHKPRTVGSDNISAGRLLSSHGHLIIYGPRDDLSELRGSIMTSEDMMLSLSIDRSAM
jgi:hypothetical protein